MNARDFLLDPNGKDWNRLLAYWSPPLPPGISIWLLNYLADLFYATASGEIHVLVVGTAETRCLAASREDFARRLDDRRNMDDWLRVSLVEECRKTGLRLKPDECLGFKVPPALLGSYDVANLQPTNIYSHYSWLSHLARKDEIYWVGD